MSPWSLLLFGADLIPQGRGPRLLHAETYELRPGWRGPIIWSFEAPLEAKVMAEIKAT